MFFVLVLCFLVSCNTSQYSGVKSKTAAQILGNSNYKAISYGGYRTTSREDQPTQQELKDDLKILHAMGIRILRTYNVHLLQAKNILRAIIELKKDNPEFEMYVMLGAWIDCLNAWTDKETDHTLGSPRNAIEIEQAVALVNQFPEVVKMISVGNEAMVKWATSYYVQPNEILKWVTHLQALKKQDKLPKDVWITSSDNFAAWGGGDVSYHNKDLEALIAAVDFISIHTYPFHDTHYNSSFWQIDVDNVKNKTQNKCIEDAMLRARDYAVSQFKQVEKYVARLGVKKPIHIGETGWATSSNGFYGLKGSHASDELKQALYFSYINQWATKNNVSCFYFEAFDEPWKDAQNPMGSENHFGLFTVDGKVKYALWDAFEKDSFRGMTRNGNPLRKTFGGSKEKLLNTVLFPQILEPTLN